MSIAAAYGRIACIAARYGLPLMNRPYALLSRLWTTMPSDDHLRVCLCGCVLEKSNRRKVEQMSRILTKTTRS